MGSEVFLFILDGGTLLNLVHYSGKGLPLVPSEMQDSVILGELLVAMGIRAPKLYPVVSKDVIKELQLDLGIAGNARGMLRLMQFEQLAEHPGHNGSKSANEEGVT